MQQPRTEAPDALPLWYDLGLLYARAGEDGRRAYMRGFAVVCVVGALVLLSAPVFGTAWAGPFAPLIPVAAGLLAGGGTLGWRRMVFLRERDRLRGSLAERGFDADRPTRDGLGAYYDAQLILLRSEYEFVLHRGARRSARLFEDAFGFTPEDPFETGPLNVAPDTPQMLALRERWERRITLRKESGLERPALGLREDRAYRVFPREMTVPMELATRRAYLEISRALLKERYGDRDVLPEAVGRRAERDLREHAALTRKPTRRPAR